MAALLWTAVVSAPALASAQQPPPAPAAARPAPAATASPCQGLADPKVAAECRGLVSGHTLMPQVAAICGRLSPAPVAVGCLQAAADRQYSADALDWCSRRATPDDVVQCFTLTGGPNRVAEAPPNDPPGAPPSPGPPRAVPPPSAPGPATDIRRQPLSPTRTPRGAQPEASRPPGSRAPSSSLDRVGRDVRGAVESPGGDWLERVGRDVRSGAETLGEALRPRPTNDPAYGPDPSVSPPDSPAQR
jgi:hypothetical protein